jgi:D-3-phosphoglycerate dehydrogenase
LSTVKAVRLNTNLAPVSDEEREFIKEAGINKLVEIEGSTPEEIIKYAEDADVLYIISANIGRRVIESLKKCKILCRLGIGVDRIDIEAATEKGIIVTNVPDFCLNEMADHAMALYLGLARKLPVMMKKMKEGEWFSVRRDEKITRIAGKKMGLIGFGNIAKEIAIRAKSFKMEIMDYHRNVNPEVEKKYGVEPVSLEKLLTESDCVMVLCPLTHETRGMIGEKELNMMKESAILINMARGPIVDEMALAEALKEKRIAGAGIDVFGHLDVFNEPEGKPQSPFFELDNVILTPHIGANSIEGGIECLRKGSAEVRRVLLGVWPENCVNLEVKPWFQISDLVNISEDDRNGKR